MNQEGDFEEQVEASTGAGDIPNSTAQMLPGQKPNTTMDKKTLQIFEHLMSERPIPEWVRTHKPMAGTRAPRLDPEQRIPVKKKYQKIINISAQGGNKGKDVGAKLIQDRTAVDHMNMRKSWKSAHQMEDDCIKKARMIENSKPTPLVGFSPIKPLTIPMDTPVAHYARRNKTKKVFSPKRRESVDIQEYDTAQDKIELIDPERDDVYKSVVERPIEGQRDVLNDADFMHLDESIMPIEKFDSLEFEEADKLPEEWVTLQAEGCTPFFSNGEWGWMKCKCVSYDFESKKFTITFDKNKFQPKQVSRFNILFDLEDRIQWEKRRNFARSARELAKESMRFDFYVSRQSMKDVQPIWQSTIKGIHDKVADGLPLSSPFPQKGTKQGEFLKHLTGEVIQNYSRSMKKAVLMYKVDTDKVLHDRYYELRLPPPEPKKQAPYYGKIVIPYHPFQTRYNHVAQMHFSSILEVVGIFSWLYTAWVEKFETYRFTNTDPKLALPCDISKFVDIEKSCCNKTLDKLQNDWRRSLMEKLVDNVQDIYDLFQSNQQVYYNSALYRLFKHIELRMCAQLRTIVTESVSDWLDFCSNYCGDQKYGEFSLDKALTGRVSLFKASLVIQADNKVALDPPPESFQSALCSVINDMIDDVRSIMNIDADLMALLHLEQRTIFNIGSGDPLYKDIDNLLKEKTADIKKMVDEALLGPLKLVKMFNEYAFVLDIHTEEYVEDFLMSEPTNDEINAKVEEFHSAATKVNMLAFNDEIFSLVTVETFSATKILTDKAIEIRDAFLKNIVDEVHHRNLEIIESYEEILNRVGQKPKNEEELASLKEFISKIKEEVGKLVNEVAKVKKQLYTLELFNYKVPFEDLNLAWSTMEYPKKVDFAASEAEDELEVDKVKMMDKLAIEKERFEALLEKFEVDIKSVKSLSTFDLYEANADEVNSLKDALSEAQTTADDFNKRERVFGFPPTEYPVLLALEEELAPFHKLWNNINDFFINRQEWMHGSFLQLNGKAIEEEVVDMNKSALKASRVLEESTPGAASCAAKLHECTSEFKENLPIIISLASPALKPRHWSLLSDKIGVNIDPEADEELTLKWLIDQNVGDFIEDIEGISYSANKEYTLEAGLADMKKQWALINFEVTAYKNTGSFVISGVDEIITLLDDHLAKTQSNRTSPFVKMIEGMFKSWEFKLKYSQALLDEWIKTQRTWMYLEPIFGSEDMMRQLPTEARRFNGVDALWRKTMADTALDPNFMTQCDPDKKLKDKFVAANQKLDEIQKGLSDYLEMKRLHFPRFFFLSNDELLEILSQTKDPKAVQPHLNKAFEGIGKVKFESDLKITEMISAQGEVIKLDKSVDPESGINKGYVEKWLLELESIQWNSVRTQVELALAEYPTIKRTQWTLNYAAQIILCVSQIYWTQDVTEAIKRGGEVALAEFEQASNEQLSEIVLLVRGGLTKLQRSTLGALVVIDVHARDTITKMIKAKVRKITDFEWVSQMRYYWEPSWKDGQAVKKNQKTAVARIVNAKCLYGYEYLGNTMRLVITPLTDRCYRTMIGAIDLLYGGAPEGPAGTGKTETVKDLSKAVAIQCVVFNCSDGLDYLAMAKFFKGLAGCGSWCCFDEFNRINVEVLSVIAQQILTINKAKKAQQEKFHFEGTYMRLNPNANPFITMNPGYAGRAELPDNLKALFRPCAMMVPDYALISEIRLYSFGFENARSNAQKLVRVLQLSSEQLSSQKHYDYGMRAVNSILVAAGNLRQALGEDPNWSEAKLVLRSVNDVNLAKFTVEDIPLFKGITSDLFPGVELPSADHGALTETIMECCAKGVTVAPDKTFKLDPVDGFTLKITQLYEMILVRHGVMIVGQTCSGKTSAIHCLKQAMTWCNERGQGDFRKTNIYSMNPKSILSGQLYGNFDPNTHEWSNGILAVLFRMCAQDTSPERNWMLFDGPVDAVWIENMNTVLDDNKKLCLNSGEIIKMTDVMTMMFEAEDLEQASPATVSRVGMIFCETRNLGWKPLRTVWLETLEDMQYGEILKDQKEFISGLFDWLIPPSVYFVLKNCKVPQPVTNMEMVFSCLRMMNCFLDNAEGLGSDLPKVLECCFLQAITWSVGGCIDTKSRPKFDEYIRLLMSNELEGVEAHEDFLIKNRDYDNAGRTAIYLPPYDRLLYDFRFDPKKCQWIPWIDPNFRFNIPKGADFASIVVPTIDTVRHEWMLEQLLTRKYHVLCTGETGTGKSVTVKRKLLFGMDESYNNIMMTFSAQTKANQTQDIIDNKLEKRRKGVYGPPIGTQCIIMVDDLNMPGKEEYGAQPPIEILRQWMDHAGWYNRAENEYVNLVDITYVTAMGPPGGGRTQITQRYVRHFNVINFANFNNESLARVFGTILDWYLATGFAGSIKQISPVVVDSTIEVYDKISVSLLPTPTKSHYTFNLRDISKVFQGVLQGNVQDIKDKESFIRLWFHECMRVFHDRLIDETDRKWFVDMTSKMIKDNFNVEFKKIKTSDSPIMYGNYIDPRSVQKPYVEITDQELLVKVMDEYLEDFNSMTNKPMSLVLFQNAIDHVSRISRIINQPNGNALLVGVGGSGRKSLTTLAVSVADFKIFQIEISKSYGMVDWREDLKKIFVQTGAENKPTVFLFDDTQIVTESFLEDINGILNTGEVPNLFDNEEFAAIVETITKRAEQAGVNTGSMPEMFSYFIKSSQANMHVVLCLSPIGDAFRTRLRMFPSLVNCCTIDWFTEWPKQALHSVAVHFLESIDMDETVKAGVVEVCVDMQSKATLMSKAFLSEMGRHYYVTPTSYLELINTFKSLLHRTRTDVFESKARYDNGLNKLTEVAAQVAQMQIDLTELQPKLKEATIATDKLLVIIAEDTIVANEKKAFVAKEEAICNKQAAEAGKLKHSCETDLAAAEPALEAAKEALKKLNKSDFQELKVLRTPPKAVKLVMTAVAIMFYLKPEKVKDPETNKKVDDYWGPASKQLLGDPKLIERLQEYKKDEMQDDMIDKVKVFIDMPEFDPDVVKKGSVAAGGVCLWVHAMVKYHGIAKEVEPKRKALKEAQETLLIATTELAEKQAMLKEVIDKLDALNAQLAAAEKKKKDLADMVQDCANKLKRAEALINGLGGEKTRWTELSKILAVKYENVTGDIILSSGVIAYLGSFTSHYRSSAITQWSTLLQEKSIPSSDDFSLANTLGEPVAIREWVINKLPNDGFSIDNAIMLTKSNRWPLMIDPQGQANKWIKNTEGPNGLKVIKQNQSTFVRTIENALPMGIPILLENVGESLDPVLEPLLLKQIMVISGNKSIKLGDGIIDYDDKFQFYITSKLSNPHYPPETCVKVNLLNFMATQEGLEDQMLGFAVAKEKPALATLGDKLVIEDANNKKVLKDIEDTILRLLKESQGDILDDEVLIDTLAKSKVTSNIIEQKVKEQIKSQELIAKTRESYIPVAYRVSQLFFCIADLNYIDPMYQYSLEWYINLYLKAFVQAEQGENHDERLHNLKEAFTFILYINVCRSLFEKDKLLFSFLLTIRIMLSEQGLNPQELRFFLQGSTAMDLARPNNISWLPDNVWADILELGQMEAMKDFDKEIENDIKNWEAIYNSTEPQVMIREQYSERFTPFQLLCIIRAVKPDVVIPCVQVYVSDLMGTRFIEPPPFNLKLCYEEASCSMPLIFVLTPGADPMSELFKLAEEMGYGGKKLTAISLGQGQGPLAENAISEACDKGTWVCLQNCHLCVSWMPVLEKICEELSPDRIHQNFRLWLTSEPSKAFPQFVLQNGVKMTNEPPKGMRANLLGSYYTIEEEFFEGCNRPREFKKLLFGLCFFHALVRERLKFGPLGWNVKYVFSGPDFQITMDQLKIFLDDLGAGEEIPYPALAYLAGECNYGGRVTDDKDRRTLVNLLSDFYCANILDDDYKFSPSGTYHAPLEGDKESVVEYIRTLPHYNAPEVFGLHDNANISCALGETNLLLGTALSLQPKSSGGAGKSWDEILTDLSSDIARRIPKPFDLEKALLDFPVRYDESMNTVLTQELGRFNTLTVLIAASLYEFGRALKGLVVMSGELEAMGNSMFIGRVPGMWTRVAYPSLKPLGGWVNDFLARLEFLGNWNDAGCPPSKYWVSGFFFTQAFITGTLQNFARKYKIPIDQCAFDFRVLTTEETEKAQHTRAEDGAYMHGLFLEGARWDVETHVIAESHPRVLFVEMAYFQLLPKHKDDIEAVEGIPELYSGDLDGAAHVYMCPVYKTSVRAGVLLTTGHSTNFVMYMRIPMSASHQQKHWVKRGVAMLTQLDT